MGTPILIPPGQPLPMREGEFVSQTQAPLASFTAQGLQPPSRVYVALDDTLFVSVFNAVSSQVVTIHIRLLLPTGTIQELEFNDAPTGGRFQSFFVHTLAEGFLLSVTASCSQSTQGSGPTFVGVSLLRGVVSGQFLYDTLLQGYVALNMPLSYPESPLRRATDGRGVIVAQAVTNPGVGVDWTDTVPANTRRRVICGIATLVTDATAGNRTVRAELTIGTTVVYRRAAAAVQAPSTTVAYVFGDVGADSTLDATTISVLLPREHYLSISGRFRVNTLAKGAADQWSNIVYLVEDWIDDL